MTAAGSADPLGIVSKGVGFQTSCLRINTNGVKKCRIAAALQQLPAETSCDESDSSSS